MAKEKSFSYNGLTEDETIKHLARFVADLWQIHIFGEGNTRTTAVFLIKYLRTLGYDVSNDIFANNAWYFRNALVRANYNNIKDNVFETTKYLELFLRNLLLNEKNELHNRMMHISGQFEKVNIEKEKVNIGTEKVNIDIFSPTVKKHVKVVYTELGDSIFGRSDVERVTGLKATRSTSLIKEMANVGIIIPVKGYGKGKYKFIQC